MKSRIRHTRAIRSLALTGCVIASLATPTLAGAVQVKPDTLPSAGAHYEGSVLVGGDQSANVAAPAPSGARYEGSVLVGAAQSAKVPTAPPPVTATPAPTTAVVHQQVTSSDSDRTLAIALASAALGIALCGSAFAIIRVTRMQRRVLSSS
jgi:hypothetical protein